MPNCIIPEYCEARALVLGCGNVLFGDDGFGPEVAWRLLKNYPIPPGVFVMEARVSVREILFDLILSKKRPEKIIIVDAIDAGRAPGEVFEIDLSQMPANKIDDFSMHQLPTSNLLRELKEICGVEVIIVSAQVEHIPESVSPGLSSALSAAVPTACKMVIDRAVFSASARGPSL